MVECPHCKHKVPPGRFCDWCRKPLGQTSEEAPGGSRQNAGRSGGEAPASVTFAVDRLSVLYEGLVGTVRFHLSVSRGLTLRNVRLVLSNDSLGRTCKAEALAVDDESGLPELERRRGNLVVQFPKLDAGSYIWNLVLSFDWKGIRRSFASHVELVVAREDNPQAVARQIVVNINNDIHAEGVSDVSANTRISDVLSGVLNRGEDPTNALRKLVNGRARAWCDLPLNDADNRMTLPPQPAEAVANRLTLGLGTRRLKLFSARTVVFGRHDSCDIFLRPANPDTCSEAEALPYFAISRFHCRFESCGDGVAIREGVPDGQLVLRPTSHGTFWNGRQVGDDVVLKSGEEGRLSFGLRCPGVHAGNCVSMSAKACSPKFACAKCPYADREWCGSGRPSLALTRLDGISETFVCMWSCLHLGEIDRTYEGAVIFRKDGAFAWCRGERCGWLVPGTKVETEYGAVTVSA